MRIGRYETLRELGRGAMGVVYEARDTETGKSVALKTLSIAKTIPEEFREQFEKRFYQEARAAGSLEHPGIVGVYEVGQDPATKTPFMALEFLNGRPLDVVLKDGALAWPEALRIVSSVAAALEVAHGRGIVHRDLKPANVMLLASGETKIMDFGVAKVDSSHLTSQGQVLGSPSYMAPEQAMEARADSRSDLFSMGSLLYELLTGRRAFPGRGLSDILMKVINQHPEPPSRSVLGLPDWVDAIVARALAKLPNERYATARQLIEDLEDVRAGRAPRHVSGEAELPEAEELGAATLVGGSGPALALPKGKRVTLALMSGPRSGESFLVDRPSIVIGRKGAGAAALELDDGQVSRAHAVVECRGARVLLRDLESTNGTFVGAERIRERELQDQDEFQVGATRMLLIIADED